MMDFIIYIHKITPFILIYFKYKINKTQLGTEIHHLITKW